MKTVFSLIFLANTLFSNPFEIDFEKENLTHQDYIEIDKLLLEKDLNSLMIKWHGETSHELAPVDCFINRVNRGKNWNRFDSHDRPMVST